MTVITPERGMYLPPSTLLLPADMVFVAATRYNNLYLQDVVRGGSRGYPVARFVRDPSERIDRWHNKRQDAPRHYG